MYLVRRLVGNPLTFYVVLSIVIIIIGQLPVFLHILHTPKGAYYPYLDTLAPSDYYYPALIRFGMGSSWLLKIPYVINEHSGSLIQVFFILLGKIALLSGFGPAEVFALSRVVGGIVFIVGVVYFIHQILPKEKAKWAFCIFLLAQPLPTFAKSILREDVGMWVWHFGEAARRVSAVPSHYTIGKGLTVLALGMFFCSVKTRSMKHAIASGVVVFIAGMIYPPPVFMILFSLIVTVILWLVVSVIAKRKLDIKAIFTEWDFQRRAFFLFFLFASILPLVVLRLELNKGYPWDMWQRVELGWNDPAMRFEANYIRQLGGILLLLPFAAVAIIKKKHFYFLTTFTIMWAFSAFFLFPFSSILSLGKFRFTEGVQIVPLSILAFSGFTFLKSEMDRIAGNTKARAVMVLVIAVFVLSFLLFTTLTAKHSTLALWEPYTNSYLPSSEREALMLLSTLAPSNSVVVADLYSSNYIPIFARVRTIIGFSDFFPSFSSFQKEHETINAFLTETLSKEEALSYLLSRKARYVYHKSRFSQKESFYPTLLDPIFEKNDVVVYRVKSEVFK